MKAIKLILFALTTLSLVMTQLFLSSCDSAKSRARKIVVLRSERKVSLDKLYQDFGGSDLAQSVSATLKSGSGSGNTADNQFSQGLANITQGVDRSVFEQNIQTVGRGEQPLVFTDKSKQFFLRQDVVKRAKKVYEMELELETLENKQNR